MFRKLTLAAAIAASLSPMGAHALGLGDIHLKSALNQIFSADIDLLSVKRGEIDGVKVELGSSESFAQAGIDRPFLLTNLKFKSVRLGNGSSVIRITSKQPIREPFLNFLIEVNWPQGRLIRSYTVLLDPPAAGEARQLQYLAPVVEAAPRKVQTASVPAPTSSTQQSRWMNRDSKDRHAATGLIRRTGNGLEYGPVRNKDTLWSIAKRMDVKGATVPQVIIALLRNNPGAFDGGNVNNLKAGKILRLPDLEQVGVINRGEANREFREQTGQWSGPRSAKAMAPEEDTLKLASAEPEEEKPGREEEKPSAVGRVVRLEKDLLLLRESNEAQRQEGDELRTRITELETQLNDVQKLLTLKNDQLAQIQVSTEASDAESAMDKPTEVVATAETDLAIEAPPAEEMPTTEVTEVETSDVSVPAVADTAIEGADDLVAEAKDAIVETTEELSTAESVVDEAAQAVDETAEVLDEQKEVVEETVQTATDTPSAEEVPAQVEEIVTDVVEQPSTEPTEVEPALTTETETTTSVEVEEPAVEDTTTTESAITPVETKKDTMPSTPEAPFWEKYTKDPKMLGAGAGVAVLLGSLFWVFRRRRRQAEDELEESILVGAGGEVLHDVDLDDTEIVEHSEETSFLSDFTPSDINSLNDDIGEVDAMSEADVYIAYGRYQQAEELMQQAIENEPDRLDLRHKLLEILAASNDKAGFVKIASAMVAVGTDKADPDAWEKVVSMGRDIAPEESIFNEGDAAPAHGLKVVSNDVSEEGAATYDLPEEPEVLDDDLTEGLDEISTEASVEDLEFNLDDYEDLNAEIKDLDLDIPEAPDDLVENGLDFDLSDGDLPDLSKVEETIDLPGVDGLAEAVESLNLESVDKDLGEIELNELDIDGLDLDGLGLNAVDEPGIDSDSEISGGLDLSDIDMDELNAAVGMGADDGFSEGLAGEPDAIDADEVNTKLDLARAYVDMGDSDGARGILDEVLNEGSAEQKKMARTLMEQLVD